MRPILAIGLATLALAGCNRSPAEPRVIVEHVAVALPAVPGRPGAAYFTLRTNRFPTNLISVTSPLVQRIELHESKSGCGTSGMAPLDDTTFPGNGRLEFEPGGKHAMLFGIHKSIEAGGSIPLTFTFDPAPAVTVEAEVRGPGQGGHGAH